MGRAQSKFPFGFLAGRQLMFVVLTTNISVFSSAHVPARDQNYLDTINEEAQSLEEVGNTDAIETTAASPATDSTPQHPRNDFLQQIYTQLNSNGDREAAYLKQLENEVQELSDTSEQTKTPTNTSIEQQQSDLSSERNKVIEITETQRKEMEFALESKIPGIYRLYNKLGSTQKRLVVKEYLANEKISTASKTILKLYSGNGSF